MLFYSVIICLNCEETKMKRKYICLLFIASAQETKEDNYTPIFTATVITVAKRWKQPKCAKIDEQINKT